MNSGIFVTGTDTGVGKTVISAALARRLLQMRCSVGVMKPVETGVRFNSPDESDAARMIVAAGLHDALELVCPYRFRAPLAPVVAAGLEGVSIEVEGIVGPYRQLAERHAFMVVEGAGGVLVPMGQDWTVRDLIARLGLPVVLVGRAGLGGINHALLTLESLGREGIVVKALVLNQTVGSRTSLNKSRLPQRCLSCENVRAFRCWGRFPINQNLIVIGSVRSNSWLRAIPSGILPTWYGERRLKFPNSRSKSGALRMAEITATPSAPAAIASRRCIRGQASDGKQR